MSPVLGLVVLGWLCGLGPGSIPLPRDYASAMDELDAGRFVQALTALEDEADPVLQRRGRIEIHYRGRDWGRVLSEVAQDPSGPPPDAWSLWRGAAAALWVPDGPGALRLAERLDERLAAGGAVEADQLEWWRAQASAYARDARALIARDTRRDAALRRARWVAVSGLVACLVGLVAAARQCRFSTPPPAGS